MYGDKVRAKTVQLWSFAPLDKQPVIYQHSQILLYQDSKKEKQKQYIIPWDEWVPVLESAYDLIDTEASTSYQVPARTAQLVSIHKALRAVTTCCSAISDQKLVLS